MHVCVCIYVYTNICIYVYLFRFVASHCGKMNEDMMSQTRSINEDLRTGFGELPFWDRFCHLVVETWRLVSYRVCCGINDCLPLA